MNNTIKKATTDNFGRDDFNVNEHITKINDLVEMLYFETTSFWIKKYEPSPIPPISLLLESPAQSLPDVPTDTIPVIPNQEAQLVGILKMHEEAIGWDISEMRNNDIEIFMTDLSIVGTTFEDCLQNLLQC